MPNPFMRQQQPNLAELFRQQRLGQAMGPQPMMPQPLQGPQPGSPMQIQLPPQAQQPDGVPNIQALIAALGNQQGPPRPQREDYPSSEQDRLYAILGAVMSGKHDTQDKLDRPYTDAVSDWESGQQTAQQNRRGSMDQLSLALGQQDRETSQSRWETRSTEREEARKRAAELRTLTEQGDQEQAGLTAESRANTLAETIRHNKAMETRPTAGQSSLGPRETFAAPTQQFQAEQLGARDYLRANPSMDTAFQTNESGNPIGLLPQGQAKENVNWGFDTVLDPEQYEAVRLAVEAMVDQRLSKTKKSQAISGEEAMSVDDFLQRY